jgi:hypothetical protein
VPSSDQPTSFLFLFYFSSPSRFSLSSLISLTTFDCRVRPYCSFSPLVQLLIYVSKADGEFISIMQLSSYNVLQLQWLWCPGCGNYCVRLPMWNYFLGVLLHWQEPSFCLISAYLRYILFPSF